MKNLPLQRSGLTAIALLFVGTFVSAQDNTTYRHYDFKATNYNYNYSEHRDPCKVFIGVGTSNVEGGLKVDYTVDNTPATEYGVLAGDLILSMDGVPVRSQAELLQVRDRHQQGESFTLAILRNGQSMNIAARFKSCSAEEQEKYKQRNDNRQQALEQALEQMRVFDAKDFMTTKGHFTTGGERVILGVYENENVSEQGLVIDRVVSGKGAEAAGLQSGDVVLTVDGQTVTGSSTLRRAIGEHKPGDRVTVIYLRDGQRQQTELTLSSDRSYSYTYKHDPCKVFIGVYTADIGAEEDGVRVTGIVDDTPAKQSDVQPGDIILALDGQAVNSTGALLRERDKHQPGDAFTLTIMRDGASRLISARFKTCDTPAKETVIEEAPTEKATGERQEGPVNVESTLILESLQAYPNPTSGPVNVRFEAEAVPTTVRILDITGKTVYSKTLNQFNGYFNEQINLFGNRPGTYIISVQQGEKVSTKKIVLVAGA